MALLGSLGAGVALNACSSGSDEAASTSTSTPTPDTRPPADEHVELEAEMRDLRLRLRAEPAVATIVEDAVSVVWSFGAEVLEGDPAAVAQSGSYLGPTLHLRTGQRVRVTFENRLEQPSIVHWHGLVVPQDQDGQPPDAVDPGDDYEYDFVVANEPGTYWYHPHPHGMTGEQVYRGLAGVIVVHGEEPSLPDGDNDVALVLQDRTIDDDGRLVYVGTMHDTMAGFVGDTLVTNGVAGFEMEVRREPYRVRILNGANSSTRMLTLGDGAAMIAVATDGHLLPEARQLRGLVLTPAQRTDLWIDFASYEAGTRVELRSAATFVESSGMGGGMNGGMGGGMGSGAGSNGSTLELVPELAATFVVTESPAKPSPVPTKLGGVPRFGPADAVNADRPKEFVLSTRRASHWINDAQWDGRTSSELETVAANSVELWEFVNESPMAHPMHLHGVAFRVVERTWDSEAAVGSWDAIEPGIVDDGRRDTVLVWPGQRVRVAVPFGEHLGYFLYHCHILEHEDAGMMRNFRVT